MVRHRESAESSVNGSKEVTVWLRFRASTGIFSTARWSAMKKASKLARRASGRRAHVRDVEVHVRQAPG